MPVIIVSSYAGERWRLLFLPFRGGNEFW